MSIQDKTVEGEVCMRCFKIGVTAAVIGQIPSAGSVEKLPNDQALHAARTDGKYRLSRGRLRHRECGQERRDCASVCGELAQS